MNSGNIAALTGLRSYAAIWVMVLHLQFSIGVKPQLNLGPLIEHGFWAVDLFFVLSGFLLSMIYAEPLLQQDGRGRRYWNYIVARFARIYPLHLVCLLALAAWYFGALLFGHIQRLPPGFNLPNFLANLSLLHAWGYADRLSWNYPSWSISAEWFAYLIMLPAMSLGLKRLALPAVLLGATLLWVALWQALYQQGQMVGEQHVTWGVPRIIVGFVAGYAMHRLAQQWRPAPGLSDFLALLSVVTLIFCAFAGPFWEVLVLPACSILVFSLSATGRAGRVVFANRAAVFWGERSYAIYMLHAPVQIFCNLALLQLGLTEPKLIHAILLFSAQALAVLLLSHLAYHCIEIPGREWLRSRWQK